MSTFLFDQLVFGPVQSRRLGVSLGVNLLPPTCKYCNFDCIYCECGWNDDHKISGHPLPKRYEIYEALENKLQEMLTLGHTPDAITFAGNGEPTIHPEFPEIIEDTIQLRNHYAPKSKISVLTNATMLHRPRIIQALRKTDLPMLKLDSAIEETTSILNQPVKKIPVPELIEQMKLFDGQCIIQTMFVRGSYKGKPVDNTTERELNAWEQAVVAVAPRQVMVYSIDRETPAKTLQKVPKSALVEIAARIQRHGIDVHVSG